MRVEGCGFRVQGLGLGFRVYLGFRGAKMLEEPIEGSESLVKYMKSRAEVASEGA